MGQRNQHSPEFKAKVALAAARGDMTANEVAKQFKIHPTLVHSWKKQLNEGAPSLFGKKKESAADRDAVEAELYEKIGRLEVELDWLKKKSALMG